MKTKKTKTTKNKGKTVKKLKTPNQKKLFELISENIGKTGPKKTLEEMMIEAGYAESTARQQAGIMAGIKESEEFGNYLERLEKHKEKIILRMEKLVDHAQYNELSMALSRIENILLLAQGKPTSNVNILTDDEKKKLDQLFDENS